MSLPELIVANNIPSGSASPQGIIYKLKQSVSDILTCVVPSSNTERNPSSSLGDITNIVTWSKAFQTISNENAYVQVEFKDRYVLATHYSLKGYSQGRCSYPKEWYIYGLDSENDTPVELATNTSVGSTYCGFYSSCNSDDWATFEIPNPKQFFRIIRLKIKTPSNSYSEGWRILLSGFEVFGIYSISKAKAKKTYCFKSYPVCEHRGPWYHKAFRIPSFN